MEVIKNNFEATKIIEMNCPHCGSLLKCTLEEKENDVCPVCAYPLTKHSTNTNVSERFLECERCDYDFFATPDGIGLYGLYYTHCPNCGTITYFDDGIEVNAENLEEDYFASYGSDAVKIDFPRIKEWIKHGATYLKHNPEESVWYSCSGDSFVLVTRDEDEYYVMWTNNYRDVWMK